MPSGLARKGGWTISTNTVSPRKPNGSMPCGRGRRRATGGAMRLARITPTAMAAEARGIVSRRHRSLPLSRTPSGSITQRVTCGSGSRTVGMIITGVRRAMAHNGERSIAVIATGVWPVAAPGSTYRGTYVRPAVSGTRQTPGTATLVSVLPSTWINPLHFVLLLFVGYSGRAGGI